LHKLLYNYLIISYLHNIAKVNKGFGFSKLFEGNFHFWHYFFAFLDEFLLILLFAVFFSYKLFPYLCVMETFNITLPNSWAELSNKQLLMVYGLFARDMSAAEVKTLCLMKWNGQKVLATLSRHRFLIKREKEPEVLSTRCFWCS